jgi:hypothetical protein
MRAKTGFGEIVQCLAAVQLGARRGIGVDRLDVARARGFEAAQREFRTKSAQGDVAAGGDFLSSEPLATAVIGSIARASLAGEIIATSRPLGSFHSRMLLTDTSKITAEVVGEGLAIPVRGTSAESIIITPGKVSIIVVYPEEMLSDPNAVAGIEHDFTIIAQRSGDAALLASFPPSSSTSFSATADSAADMRTLLGALGDLSGIAAPILVASPATLLRIGLVRDAGGWLWPEVGIAGGHMIGCGIFPTDVLDDGVLRAVSGEAVAAKFGGIEIGISAQTSLQMDTAPTQEAASGSGSSMVSMFATSTIAVRYSIAYAAVALRDTACAELAGINW